MKWELAHPELLALLAVPVLLAAWVTWRRRLAKPALRIPSLAALAGTPRSVRVRTRALPLVGRLLALALGIVALARPRGGEVHEVATTEGIDIMVVLDTSGSMMAEDMSPSGRRISRLDAAKGVATDFIGRRPADRIGLVSFDEASVPRCPPTLDHGVLLDLLQQVRIDDQGGRTAIGTALASAVNRLKTSKAKSRVVILITDGRNNAGRIGPADAAQVAKLMGVKVYAIGIGTQGLADFPVKNAFGMVQYEKVPSDVDDETLQQVADVTHGAYFRASNHADLERIFATLDRLEKTRVDVERHVRHREVFPPLVQAAAGALALALFLSATIWRTFP